MADGKKRKGGGAKLTRTQTVTVRLDEKLRYLAELAARKQRRTLSSYVEWAIQDSLERVVLKPATAEEPAQTVASEASRLWDFDEVGRFVKLASKYPDLLTHEEQQQHHMLIKQLLWDLPIHPGHSHSERVEIISDRIAMLRVIWKQICVMSPKDLSNGTLPPDVPPAPVIAEAAKKEFMEKSAAADRLRLQYRDPEPHDVNNV